MHRPFFLFYVYGLAGPGTIIVFFDYPQFFQIFNFFVNIPQYRNCFFDRNIGITSSFSSNFDFTFEQNPQLSEKNIGEICFEFPFQFFGVGWLSIYIITKRVYWFVEQVERLHPVHTDPWQMRLIFSLSLRKKTFVKISSKNFNLPSVTPSGNFFRSN